jgi:hypothetical protein
MILEYNVLCFVSFFNVYAVFICTWFLCSYVLYFGFESLVVVGEFFSFNHQKLFGFVLFCVVIRFNLCLALGLSSTKIHVAIRVRVVVHVKLGLLPEVICVFLGQ